MGIYDSLNSKQREAVLQTEGPLLILAGAGSGKTGVLTHRIAYLIDEKNVNPYNILAITFTNKAAKEMRERVDRLAGFGTDSAWVMTFHATCVRILRRYIDRLGYSTNFTIYDTDDQKNVMKEVCKKLNIDTKVYKERAILGDISKAKDELITPDDMYRRSSTNYSKMKIAEAYREYQQQLKKNNALDFDDIICLTVELFKDNKDVLDYYQQRFKYIMVDEYQDTNTAQFKLVSLLADAHRNLCVVGDDDQSIYKFRGANITNILNFEQYFPDAHVIKLEQNYRSTQNILNAANGVIKNNEGRKAKSLWTEHEEGDKLTYCNYDNAVEEAQGIADEIKRQVEKGRSLNDFAVLYRTNAQSRTLEERLMAANIPYRIYGGVNFYSRREIKDVLAYLKTIDNGRDDLAVKRILNVPKRGIGATTMDKVSSYAEENGLNFYEALRNSENITTLGRSYVKIAPFVNTIQVLRSKANELPVKSLIEEVLETTNYYSYIDENDDKEEALERKQNIDELISKAAQYDESADEPTLSGFLEEVALVADIDNLDEDNNIVSLMTLHSAKGLEFPVVFLCGMEDGLFPSYMSIASGDESDIEEERRLCYVGITRAREELFISSAKMRMVRGETQMNKPSRFVYEIPPETMKSVGAITKKAVQSANLATFPARKRVIGRPATNYGSGANFINSTPKHDMSHVFDKPVRAASAGPDLTGGPGYSVGDSVSHIKFGNGVVKNIIAGGRDYEVTVEFESAGQKKMFASFAKLKKI